MHFKSTVYNGEVSLSVESARYVVGSLIVRKYNL